jgi:hypothetical protein
VKWKQLWPNFRRCNGCCLEGMFRRDSALNRNLEPEVPNKKHDIHSGQVTVTRTIITDDKDLEIKFWFLVQNLTVKLLPSLYNELTTSNPLSITRTRYYTAIACLLLPFVFIGLRVFDVTSEVYKTEQDFCCYYDGSCCFKLEATLPLLPSNHRLTTTTVGRIYRAWTLSSRQRMLEFVLPSTMVLPHQHPVDTSASWSCLVLATNVTKTLGLLNNAISV